MEIEKIMENLSLEEKCSLLSGNGFWWTKQVERCDVPSIMMTDGPHGLRKQELTVGQEQVDKSKVAVCYPTASITACSFDRELLFDMGASIGEEALSENVSIVLGPGVNMKRNPLCGRNFEYFSEDPYLAGEMGLNFIRGLSSKGIYGSLKHFACNNQERYRMVGDMNVDERTLREIYLTAFEKVVKASVAEGLFLTVMSSYNSINGMFGSCNTHLLDDILRKEWGFDGVSMTDWGAVDDRVKCLVAGTDLEMPSSNGQRDRQIMQAVQSGDLDESYVDKAVRRILKLIKTATENLRDCSVDLDACHQKAIDIAKNSMVLLRNNNILPLAKNQRVLVVGELAKTPRFQGAGSSMINAYKVESLLDYLDQNGVDYEYKRGYDIKNGESEEYIDEAISCARHYEKVILVCGLTNEYESESYDRIDLKCPMGHVKLAEKLIKEGKKVVICLVGGSAVELDFAKNADGLIYCGLAGEGSGIALGSILYGDCNPSGRLAETYEKRLCDMSSIGYYPGNSSTTEYREGMYIGYRYFDSANIDVEYEFGYGLSYSKFDYLNCCYDNRAVTVQVKNESDVDGFEVVQVYVGKKDSPIHRPKKELKAFEKVFVKAGQTVDVQLKLDEYAFRTFDAVSNSFVVMGGKYEIYVGKSVSDIMFEMQVDVKKEGCDSYIDQKINSIYNIDNITNITREQFEYVLGRNIVERPIRPYTVNSSVEELSTCFIGRIVKNMSLGIGLQDVNTENEAVVKMVTAGVDEMSVRAMSAMSGGAFTISQTEGIVDMCNGKLFGGLKKFLKKAKK